MEKSIYLKNKAKIDKDAPFPELTKDQKHTLKKEA
jgi:hypothetical protein